MITATGAIGGVAYVVVCQTPTDGPGALSALRARLPHATPWGGLVFGTDEIMAALAAADGELVPMTPTGPDIALAAGDARSVVAWLEFHTDLASTAGMPDEMRLPHDPDVVY